jgi:hypothetical protein
LFLHRFVETVVYQRFRQQRHYACANIKQNGKQVVRSLGCSPLDNGIDELLVTAAKRGGVMKLLRLLIIIFAIVLILAVAAVSVGYFRRDDAGSKRSAVQQLITESERN